MRAALAVLAGLILAGCLGPEVQVTRFHSLPALPEGRTVEVQSADPAKRDSLEFRHYAAMVSDGLARAGYPPPAPGAAPDLVARLAWKTEGGRTQVTSTPIYGPIGPGFITRRIAPDGRPVAVYVPPPHGVVDVAHDTRTVYDVAATLDVAEARPNGATRFEGRATAVSYNADIAPIMPLLLRALLAGFPGRSGSTVTVQPEG